MSNQPIKPQASTIGTLAKQYGIDVRTMVDLINVHEDLRALTDPYLCNAIRKANKILPPLVIESIYNKLGLPT